MSALVTTLGNGVRVASQAMPGLETAAVGLYIDTGSRFEAAADNGVAHMLEHMVFKGTRRRSARRIAEEIEAVGGQLNAHTARDETAFHARVLAGDVALAVDMLADLVTEPLLDPDELAREREVVLQELGEATDTPDDIVFDHLHSLAFAGQGLGRPVLGVESSIKAIESPTLSRWLDDQYRGGSIVLAAAGKVDHDALVELAGTRLASLPAGVRGEDVTARPTGGELRDVRALEQVQVALGLPGVSFHDPDYFPLMLFSGAYGGGMSSRLFQQMREERGLVYSIYSYMSPFQDSGLFGISLATDADACPEAATLALDILRATADGLEEAELQRARAQMKAALFMGLESCAGVAGQLGRQLLGYDRIMPTAELIARIDACTLTQCRAAAAAMLAAAVRLEALSLALVGPETDVPPVDRLLDRLR